MLRFIAFRSFRNRKFISLLCIISIALSLSLFLIVEKLRNGIEEGFTNSISNADLIVGARSGPLQLLLYSVFHMGSPTNNITMETYKSLKSHPLVDWTIPLSLGDSYRGHRVIATNKSFYEHYQFYGDKSLQMREGKWSDGIFDVVIGSQVANNLKHKLYDSIVLTHGISEESIFKHDNSPFKIVGILKSTGTPVDKSLYITLKGMEAMHIGWENGVPNFGQPDQASLNKENLKPSQITAFILRTKNRIALLQFQRLISTYEKESLSAIIPAMTLTELWKLLDQVEKAFLGISFFVIMIGFLSILISLYMSLSQRKREIAILRSVGASAREITFLLMLEATILSTFGAILGFILQYAILSILGPIIESKYALLVPISAPTSQELFYIISSVLLGSIFGVVPALKAYQSSLNNGLTPR